MGSPRPIAGSKLRLISDSRPENWSPFAVGDRTCAPRSSHGAGAYVSPARADIREPGLTSVADIASPAENSGRQAQCRNLRWLSRLAVHRAVWLIVVCGLAVGLRILFLGEEAFWGDEAFSWGFAKFSLLLLWGAPPDIHPPVYYSLLHVLMYLSDTRWMLRLPSALSGALAVPLAYVLGLHSAC